MAISCTKPYLAGIIIHELFLLACGWSKHVTWANISQLKLVNIREYSPNFQNCACCDKYLKDNKQDSLHLGQKYAQRYCHWISSATRRSQFSSSYSCTPSENCSLLETDNVCRQISQYIFVPNGGYCLFIYIC